MAQNDSAGERIAQYAHHEDGEVGDTDGEEHGGPRRPQVPGQVLLLAQAHVVQISRGSVSQRPGNIHPTHHSSLGAAHSTENCGASCEKSSEGAVQLRHVADWQ